MTCDGTPMNELDPSVTTTLALVAVARERFLTAAGERPFHFADEVAEILAAVIGLAWLDLPLQRQCADVDDVSRRSQARLTSRHAPGDGS